MKPSEQVHFKILRAIESNPEITQRDLAQTLGVSKGKTNYLIAALLEKGLIKIESFQRHEGKLGKIAYLLTPEGIKNRTALTRTTSPEKKQNTKYSRLKSRPCAKWKTSYPALA